MKATRLREIGAAVSFHIREITVALAFIAGGASADELHTVHRLVGGGLLGLGIGLLFTAAVRVLIWSAADGNAWGNDFRVHQMGRELRRIAVANHAVCGDVVLIDRGRRVGIVRVLPDTAPDKAECAFEMLAASVEDGFTTLSFENERVAGVVYRGRNAAVVRGMLKSLPGVIENLTRPAKGRLCDEGERGPEGEKA